MKQLLTILLFVSLSAGAQDTITVAGVFGQSQAEGYGSLPKFYSPYSTSEISEKQRIWNQSTHSFEKLTITPFGYSNNGNPIFGMASPPINLAGVEMALSRRLMAITGDTAYIVKYAMGSTMLSPDAGRVDWSASTHELLDDFITRLVAAKNRLQTQFPDKYIKVTLFFLQGESDAWANISRATYLSELNAMYAAICTALGQSNIPIYQTQVDDNTGGTMSEIQQAKLDFVGANPTYRALTSMASYTKVDDYHVNATGLISLGEKAAAWFTNTTYTPTTPPANPSGYIDFRGQFYSTADNDWYGTSGLSPTPYITAGNGGILSLNHTAGNEYQFGYYDAAAGGGRLFYVVFTGGNVVFKSYNTTEYTTTVESTHYGIKVDNSGVVSLVKSVDGTTWTTLYTSSNTGSQNLYPYAGNAFPVQFTDFIFQSLGTPDQPQVTPMYAKVNFQAPTTQSSDYSGTVSLPPVTGDYYVLSNEQSRDQSLTFPAINNGVVILRSRGDTGIGVLIRGNNIGLAFITDVSKVKDVAYPSINDLYAYGSGRIIDNDQSYTLAGYPTGNFEVKAEGFDIVVMWNGAEVKRWSSIVYAPVGKIGLVKFNSTSISGNLTANFFTRKPLISNTDASEVNIYDVGAKKGHTKGSFSEAGSNVITVWNPDLYKIGDRIVVAVGNELDGSWTSGNRKAKGIGGQFPDNEFADSATLVANTTIPIGGFAFANDTRKVFKKWDFGWKAEYELIQVAGLQYSPVNYYTDFVVPKALRAVITAINGNDLTLSINCSIAATNADVWFDNTWILNGLSHPFGTVNPYKIIIPIDTFVTTERWDFKNTIGWQIQGVNESGSVFFSPKGTPEFTIVQATNTCTDMRITNFTIIGNHTLNYYSFRWWDTAWDGGGLQYQSATAKNTISALYLPSRNYVAHLTFKEQYHCLWMGGSDIKVENLTISTSTGFGHYMAWMTGTSGDRDTLRNITFTSTKMCPFMETFGGTNNYFSNLRGRNMTFSSNGGVNLTISNIYDTIGKNSNPFWQAQSNPIVNANNNNGYGSGSGGLFDSLHIHYEGYIDTATGTNTNTFISQQESVPNTIIRNIWATADASIVNLTTTNINVVKATGANTTIENINCAAHSKAQESSDNYSEGDYNVSIRSGVVRNCNVNTLMYFTSGQASSTSPVFYFNATETGNTVSVRKQNRTF